MSATKIDRIENIDSKIRQLQNEKKRIISQHKESERKARTKRLIERGAILESVLTNLNELSNEQIKRFLETTVVSKYAEKKFNDAKSWKPDVEEVQNQTEKVQKEKPETESEQKPINDQEQVPTNNQEVNSVIVQEQIPGSDHDQSSHPKQITFAIE